MAEAQKKDSNTTNAAAPAEEKKTPITVIEEDDEFEVPLKFVCREGGGARRERKRAGQTIFQRSSA